MKWEEKPKDSIESIEWGMFTGMYSTLGQCVAWLDRDRVYLRLLEEVRSSEECAWNAAAHAWELAYDEEDDPSFMHPYDSALLAILYSLCIARRRDQFELAAEAARAMGHRARMASTLVDGLAPEQVSAEDLLDMEAAETLLGWRWVHKPNPVIGFVTIGTVVEPGYVLQEGARWGRGEFQWRNPVVPRFMTDPSLLEQTVERAEALGAAGLRIEGGPGSWTASFSTPSRRLSSASASTISAAVSSAAVAAARALAGGQAASSPG